MNECMGMNSNVDVPRRAMVGAVAARDAEVDGATEEREGL